MVPFAENNLVVFCFYNKDGIVGEYVVDLLCQLKTLSSRIIFVSNGKVGQDGKHKIISITNEIIERDNIGYDYGAYRQVLLNYLTFEDYISYNRIIFCNDTFYGFFVPIEAIFSEMTGRNVNIWGINKVDRNIINCIQSYFLVFTNIGDLFVRLKEFFQSNEMGVGDSFGKASALLEPKLFKWAKDNGFSIDSYTNTGKYSIYGYPFKCITEYGLPILKRKCFYSACCDKGELQKVIDYLMKHKLYNTKCIIGMEVPERTIVSPPSKTICKSVLSEDELLGWANEGPFYIWGAGLIGNQLYYTYFQDNSNFRGFVVTDREGDSRLYQLEDLPANARVLMGVKEDYEEEIFRTLPGEMSVLKLWR